MSGFAQSPVPLGTTVVLAAVAVAFVGAARNPATTTFDEITVHRIKVVEPDGTLRMVISNKAMLPGVIVKGKEQRQSDRPQAGMLFYNDEGSENGGLIFSGHKGPDGRVLDSGGSLSFDKYGENQIVQLAGVDDSNDRFAGLAVGDQARRLWAGRTANGDASVALMDAAGHKRLLLRVAADGKAEIQFLDANGKVLKELGPAAAE
jgi:hypothetical protein